MILSPSVISWLLSSQGHPQQARGTCLLLLHYLLQQNICRRLDKIIHSLNNTDLMFQRPILHEWCCVIQITLIQFVVEGLSFVGVTFGEDFVGVTGIGSSCSSSWTCMWYLYSFSVVCRWPVIQEVITILSFLIYSTPFWCTALRQTPKTLNSEYVYILDVLVATSF